MGAEPRGRGKTLAEMAREAERKEAERAGGEGSRDQSKRPK